MTECYCSKCKENISHEIFGYSMDMYNKALCRNCQPKKKFKFSSEEKTKKKSTPEAMKLHNLLKERGIKAELEKWDKHKHIDIAIVKANLNIEIDGKQHHKPKQALADLKRTFYSYKKGYFTLRLPNSLIKGNCSEVVDLIEEMVNHKQ